MYTVLIRNQIKRAFVRCFLFLTIALVAAAFFCLSANLYRNSRGNLAAAEDAFSTIGVLEFYQTLDADGNRVDLGGKGRVGAFSTAVADLDLQALRALPGVTGVDLRPMFAAYIPGHTAYEETEQGLFPGFWWDGIIFTLAENQPVTFDPAKGAIVEITVLENTNKAFEYPARSYELNCFMYQDFDLQAYEEAFALLGQDGMIRLEPGINYLAFIENRSAEGKTESGALQIEKDLLLLQDAYAAEIYPRYRNGIAGIPLLDTKPAAGQTFWLWKQSDAEAIPSVKSYWEAAAQAYQYSASSFAVMATNGLDDIVQFHQGQCFIAEGRGFSAEDYCEGNRVCVVSRKLAEQFGWQVGDLVDMQFYPCDTFFEDANGNAPYYSGHLAVYQQDCGGFFDGSAYTIVGIWEEQSTLQVSTVSSRTALLWNTILVPTGSVQNLDTVEAPASGSRLTVHLENGMMEAFLEAAAQVTLSESADEVKITAFDQGYSQAQDSLQSMLGTAQFLLTLSSVLLLVAGVLLAFFYTQSQKGNMALMRLLGCSRRQAGTMSLLGSLLILLPGGVLGTAAGHLMTNRVAGAILNSTNSLDKPEYAGFREIFGVQAEVEFALSARTSVSAAALGVAAGLFLLACTVFTLLLLRKEPRAALTDK